MATQLQKAGDFKRQDTYLVHPKYIHADPTKRGRVILPTEEDIERMAASIETEGQLQPVTCRKLADQSLELVFGFTRHAAMLALAKGKTEAEARKIKLIISDLSEEDALRKNIVENRERNLTTAVDDAHNQRRLREEYGWSEQQIADFYRMSTSRVSSLRKLLGLPKDIQARIGTDLNAAVAIELADLPVKAQRELLDQFGSQDDQVRVARVQAGLPAEAPEEPVEANGDGTAQAEAPAAADTKGGKKKRGRPAKAPKAPKTPKKPRLTAAAVRAKKRESEDASGRKSRTFSEVRKFFEERYQDPEEDKPIKDFSQALLRFVAGDLENEALHKALRKLQG